MDGMGSIIIFDNRQALAAVAVVAIASSAQRCNCLPRFLEN
jgi:hypothetical protein